MPTLRIHRIPPHEIAVQSSLARACARARGRRYLGSFNWWSHSTLCADFFRTTNGSGTRRLPWRLEKMKYARRTSGALPLLSAKRKGPAPPSPLPLLIFAGEDFFFKNIRLKGWVHSSREILQSPFICFLLSCGRVGDRIFEIMDFLC